MRKKRALTECELTIMKIIWDADEPITNREILKALKEKYGLDYKRTSVYTFLEKLREKGFVEVYDRGLLFYTPIVSETDFRKKCLKEEKEFWANGSLKDLFTIFGADEGLSDRDIDEIRRILAKYEEE